MGTLRSLLLLHLKKKLRVLLNRQMNESGYEYQCIMDNFKINNEINNFLTKPMLHSLKATN